MSLTWQGDYSGLLTVLNHVIGLHLLPIPKPFSKMLSKP